MSDAIQQYEQQQANLDNFAFIAQTNTGDAPLSASDIQRLTALSRITWQRHFDDRLGLSPIEARQMADQESELPATENLLSDKPIHQIPHPIIPEFDPKLGIKMAPPEYLQNLGELYNLITPSGTLTAEDRYKIDPDVFALFITSGVCMEYAKRHLPPDLIDTDDLRRFLDTDTLSGTTVQERPIT